MEGGKENPHRTEPSADGWWVLAKEYGNKWATQLTSQINSRKPDAKEKEYPQQQGHLTAGGTQTEWVDPMFTQPNLCCKLDAKKKVTPIDRRSKGLWGLREGG